LRNPVQLSNAPFSLGAAEPTAALAGSLACTSLIRSLLLDLRALIIIIIIIIIIFSFSCHFFGRGATGRGNPLHDDCR
jgi:hypothetical protein